MTLDNESALDTEVLATKLAQFDEFFSITHQFNVNVRALSTSESGNFEQFLTTIPVPFKMASDMVGIDQAALRPLQAVSGVAAQLVDYLNHQSHKIDLLVGYILSQQDEQQYRHSGVKFGGGGIVLRADQDFTLGQLLELKLFFVEENSAVFCHGEVIEITNSEATTQDYKIIFKHIREEDREILVRASLHQQSKQLQSLAKKRNQESQA